MPPQVATRVTSPSSMKPKTKATPATVGSSADAEDADEKLGAHGAKVKHKRRFCRVEGCERIVKSQGLCQRHGAKPRLCKVDGCTKQAQGNFDGTYQEAFDDCVCVAGKAVLVTVGYALLRVVVSHTVWLCFWYDWISWLPT